MCKCTRGVRGPFHQPPPSFGFGLVSVLVRKGTQNESSCTLFRVYIGKKSLQRIHICKIQQQVGYIRSDSIERNFNTIFLHNLVTKNCLGYPEEQFPGDDAREASSTQFHARHQTTCVETNSAREYFVNFYTRSYYSINCLVI